MGETRDDHQAILHAKEQKALWVTYVNIVLYGLCFQLQRPVEPFLVKSLSSKASDPALIAQTYGRLQSFFNTAQTFGSPLVGILLDRVGVRYASVIVFAATALSYAILACASDLPLLFLSKVPTVLQAAFLVAQATAAIATSGDASTRAKALGRMTTAYTIGATIGPALGGHLASRDLYLSAKIAVLGSLVSVLLSFLYLPNASNTRGNSTDNTANRSFMDAMAHTREIAFRPSVCPFLILKVVGGVVASMHSTALPMTLTQSLNFEPSQLGLSMSASMFAVAGFGAVCMSPLTDLLGPVGMAKAGLGGRALMAALIATVVTTATGNDQTVVLKVAAASVVHALAAHTLATGLTTQTTGLVEKHEQGTLLGLEHSLFSLARIAGPSFGTNLLANGGFWHVASACGAVDLALVVGLVTISTPARTPKASSDKES